MLRRDFFKTLAALFVLPFLKSKKKPELWWRDPMPSRKLSPEEMKEMMIRYANLCTRDRASNGMITGITWD